MENLSNNVANKIAFELKLDDDKKEVIAYGTFALFQMTLSIVLIIVFGYMFHVLIEALIISFSAAILRKYSGGVHTSSPGICTFIGTCVCIVQAVMISIILNKYILSLEFTLILGAMIFSWAYYLVYKLSPVDNPNKIIHSEKKRIRLKKKSMQVLSIYLFVVLLCGAFYLTQNNQSIIIYIVCLYLGIIWQVFTLTKVGHLILNKADGFLNQILDNTGRRK